MDFLLSLSERFFEKRAKFYANNVSFFSNFLKEKGVCDDTLVPFLRGIRTEDVIESLNAYITSNRITSIETANRYMWALKDFLYFVLHDGGISNMELLKELESPPFKETSYIYKMRKAISNHSLRQKEAVGALSTEEVHELLTKCNEILTSKRQYEKASEIKKYFNQYRSALLVKVMLLTGGAYRTLRKIKRTDFDTSHGSIHVNEYQIRLPKSLQTNFQTYLEVIDRISQGEDLFIEFDGRPMSNQTSTLSNFLTTVIDRGDVNGVIKYAIIHMIRAGMNETTIKKMTGIDQTILEDCHGHVFDMQTETRHLDATIRSLEIYDLV